MERKTRGDERKTESNTVKGLYMAEFMGWSLETLLRGEAVPVSITRRERWEIVGSGSRC